MNWSETARCGHLDVLNSGGDTELVKDDVSGALPKGTDLATMVKTQARWRSWSP